MFKTLTTIACLSLVGVSGALAAVPLCGARAYMQSLLAQMGEAKIAGGLSKLQPELRVLELFVHPSTRAWTLLKTDQAGWACIVDQGHSFRVEGDETIPEPVPAPPPRAPVLDPMV